MDTLIAVPVDESLASSIGKRGSSNSITFYNRKIENDTIVVMMPVWDDERVYALAESLLLASSIVLSTSVLDKRFGEALVASSLLDKKVLVTKENDVGSMVSEAGVKDYKFVARGELLEYVRANISESERGRPVRVDIDKAFPVKGIGTVVLGIVTRGVIRQHDKLHHTSGREVVVRSLQSQGRDVIEAGEGTRIGIALKDISDDQISKGDLLVQNQVNKAGRIVIEYKTSNIAKETIAEGKFYGIALNFSYTECVVKEVTHNTLEIDLKAGVPLEIGDEAFLTRRGAPRIFASGRVKEILA